MELVHTECSSWAATVSTSQASREYTRNTLLVLRYPVQYIWKVSSGTPDYSNMFSLICTLIASPLSLIICSLNFLYRRALILAVVLLFFSLLASILLSSFPAFLSSFFAFPHVIYLLGLLEALILPLLVVQCIARVLSKFKSRHQFAAPIKLGLDPFLYFSPWWPFWIVQAVLYYTSVSAR